MRLRAVAAVLLQLQLLHAARLDSGDFNKVLGQITKGNRLEQCPCVRPPEGGACISYDSRFQASHVEEAMISFVDLTLPDRERPTDADSLACVSAECRACFSMLFYRLVEIGLVPQGYRPSIPVVPQASLNPSLCPRLRFPSATEFSGSASSALAAVPPSAAIAGLIERGNRFARAAEAAAAASEAISKLKDAQAKSSNHHGQRGRKKQNRNHESHHNNNNNNRNNNNNNNNNNQVQVTPAQNMGQGRSGTATPQPSSRQFTVQQQLRVQQPSWQQQQQMAQQAQQARWQQQQLQQQQLQQQFNTQQQQFPQQQQWSPQQQQFPQQQFNPQQVLQTARQLNTIADTITGIHEGIHAARWLNRWPGGRPPHPGPGPGPNPGWPGTGPDPNPGWPGSGPSPGGPGPGSGPSPGHGGGSSESHEDGGYHDHDHHHHHHHQQQQDPLQQFQRPDQMIPQQPQEASLPQPPPPFFGNNAGVQAGAGTQAGIPPPFPGGGLPGGGFPGGAGGSAGGGVGGGWGGGGGGRWPFRRIRSSPLERRRRRAILASQTGARHPVEMEVVSPIISPLIPKELRPEPVEVSFNHDAEHVFSEERSAFAELVRDKRQNVQDKDDGVLGSRFTIACFDRGETENGADDKMLSLCGGCWVWRRLPEGFFPPIVNELVCKKEDRCLSGWGRCVDKTRSVNVLRKVRGQWTAAALSTGTCCDCKIVAGSEIHALIVG